MTFNCRGIGALEKRRDVVNYLKKLDFDIYLLQDTHIVPMKATAFNTLWHGKCYHAYGTSNSRGVSILFKSTIQHAIIHEERCPEGNFIILVCSIFLNTYTIVNIYGPNEDCPSFFERIGERLEEIGTDNLIVGGDFNFVMNHIDDSNYIQQNNPRARNAFLRVIEENCLVDAWKEKNPEPGGITWTRQNPFKYGRLDRLYIPDHLTSHLTKAQIHPGYRSDHSIVSIYINEPQKKKGPGIWKFNDSLLKDEDYSDIIAKVIFNTIKEYAIPLYSEEFLSDHRNFDKIELKITCELFYETLLMIIRGETVRFSKRKARRSRQLEYEIMSEIANIKDSLESNKTRANLLLLEEAQGKLENIRKEKIEGLITRSRANWFEDGERCSKYFLSLEKRNALRNSILSLKLNDKTLVKKEEILNCFTNNLKEKYQQNNITINAETYLERNVKRKLTAQQKYALDAPISLDELHTALMGMKKGKSPGTNGFTSEFFKHFWNLLGVFLFRAVMEGLQKGKALNSHRESIITLIPKQGKPKDSLKGWRPISLLNVDFKIVSSVIANRLKTVIDSLISPVQTAYIPGRFIGENSRIMYDVIEFANNAAIPGVALAIDFEAAFDTVSWTFLTGALREYNFGPAYTNMIQTYYLNSANFARILLDGYLGSKIYMERGIRQGDPISGYLFNLIVEPLSNQILTSRTIQGIPLSLETEARISQYADDVILFSRPETSSIKNVLDEIQIFSSVSGLKINVEKTKCLPFGAEFNTSFLHDLGLSVVTDLKVLGITYSKSNHDIVANNISKMIPKIVQDISQWKRRNLTVLGKITVVKSMLLSKLVHIFTALPNPPQSSIKTINNLLFKFVWNDRPDKVKRNKLVQGFEFGGLKMVEVESFIKSLKVSWLKRLYWANANVLWANHIKTHLPVIDDLVCFGHSKLKELAKNLNNKFWSDVLYAWADFCAAYQPTLSEILTDKLWFSDFTKYKKSIVHAWNDRGLRFIADIYNKETGVAYDFNSLCRLFDIKMTFLCHASLIRSISTNIPTLQRTDMVPFPNIPYKISLLATKSNTSQIAYKTLVATLRRRNTNQASNAQKWLRDIGVFHNETICEIRMSTRNTYLQYFHYRIACRIVATNTFLHRIGKVESPLCSFCKNQSETLRHILWDCTVVQDYISKITRYLKTYYDTNIAFQIKSWIFPRASDEGCIRVLISTVAKLVIFKAKYNETIPDVHYFHALLKIEAKNEKCYALKTKTTKQFLKKWGKISKIIDDNFAPGIT